MSVVVRRPEGVSHLRAEREPELLLAGRPVSEHMRTGLDGEVSQRLTQTEVAENTNPVRAQLDSGTDLAQLGRLLENHGLDALAA